VKAHRGEPADEEANIQADKAISSKDVPMERQAISMRPGSAEEEVQKHRDRVKGA